MNSRRLLVWTLFTSAWTIGLLVPINIDHESLGSGLWKNVVFALAKGLHITMYLLLAYLTGWLRAPRDYRLLFLFFIMTHGAITEFLQDFVPSRSGTTRDVCIDHLGILIGLGLSWKWWTQADASHPGVDTPGSS